MSYLAKIVLPAGTKVVDIGDIPRLIASAIYPSTTSKAPVVTDLKKQMVDDSGAAVPGLLPLTCDPIRDHVSPEERLLEAIYVAPPGRKVAPMTDWAILNLAWAELPDFKTPLPEHAWKQYADAFAEQERDWRLVPEWESEHAAILILQLGVEVEQRHQLENAIQLGEITLRRASLIPAATTNGQKRDVRFVLVDELREYAARFGIAVGDAADRAVSNAPIPITPIEASAHAPHKFDTEVKGPVNWQHWKTVTTELWQALLLSLNVEPPGSGWLLNNASNGPDRTGDIPYAHLDEQGLTDEFTRRCRVLTGWLQKQHAKGGRAAEVELTEFIELPFFAALAVGFGWSSLPAEMVLLANEWKVKSKAAVSTPPASPGSSSDNAACPDRVSLHWLFVKFDENAGLIAFPEEATAVLSRTARGDERRNTNSPATSARALVERWVASRKLAIYDRRGDALLAPLTGAPVTEDLAGYQALSDNIDDEMDIDRDDLVRLMTSEGMTVPSFLRHAQAAPASTAADDARAQWWASVRHDDDERAAPAYKAKYDRANGLLDEQARLMDEERKNAPYVNQAIKKRLSDIRYELRNGPDELNDRPPPDTSAAPKPASPISRSRAQDAAILAEIRICNHDPLKLPKAPAGKPGVKAEIRKRLILQTDIFVSRKVFEDAWQRLRDHDDIRDA